MNLARAIDIPAIDNTVNKWADSSAGRDDGLLPLI